MLGPCACGRAVKDLSAVDNRTRAGESVSSWVVSVLSTAQGHLRTKSVRDFPCGLDKSPRGLTFAWLGCYGLCLTQNQPSLPTPRCSVLVSISIFMTLSAVFHSVNAPDNSPFSDAVLPVLFLPYRPFHKVSFSSDNNPSWLTGLKHHLTN